MKHNVKYSEHKFEANFKDKLRLRLRLSTLVQKDVPWKVRVGPESPHGFALNLSVADYKFRAHLRPLLAVTSCSFPFT